MTPSVIAEERPIAQLHEPARESTTRLIAHRSFPEVAAALRSQTESIIKTWMAAVRLSAPSATDLPASELQQHLPALLARLANVMESANSEAFEELVEYASEQTLTIGGMRQLLQSERLRKTVVHSAPRSVHLHQLASRAVLILAKKAEAKGVRIDVEIPANAVIYNDEELIGLIVQNLLDNAVKYSAKGTVRVQVVVNAVGCMLSVSDEGPGITIEHMDRIFEPFRRGEAHAQTGVGLGLTIASQAATLVGGTLCVESKVGIGSTFSLTLPLRTDRTQVPLDWRNNAMGTVLASLFALDGRAGVIAPVNVTLFPNGSGNFPMPQPALRTGQFTMRIAGEVDRLIWVNECSHTTAYFLPGKCA